MREAHHLSLNSMRCRSAKSWPKGAVERVGSIDDAIISYENLEESIEIKEDNQNIPNYKSWNNQVFK